MGADPAVGGLQAAASEQDSSNDSNNILTSENLREYFFSLIFGQMLLLIETVLKTVLKLSIRIHIRTSSDGNNIRKFIFLRIIRKVGCKLLVKCFY